jgi:hypothetical protein
MKESDKDLPRSPALRDFKIQRSAGYILPAQKQVKESSSMNPRAAFESTKAAAEDGRSNTTRAHRSGDQMLPESTAKDIPNRKQPTPVTRSRFKG